LVEVWIPYGDTEICANIPTENFHGLLEPASVSPPASFESLLEEALENPVGGVKLRELAGRGGKAFILLDEHAGSLPLEALALKIRGELEAGGLPPENIFFLFGRGLGQPYTLEEASSLLGSAASNCHILLHNPQAEPESVELGATSRRVKVFVRRDVAEAEIKILVGKVSPHPYAGYSGYGQTFMSAAGSFRTLKRNYLLYGSLEARAGRLKGNPLQTELSEEARLASLDFAVHVACSWEGEPFKVYAGHPEESFKMAVEAFENAFASQLDSPFKVVVASPGGKPSDSTLEGALQALERVFSLAVEDGVVVLAAECAGERLDSKFIFWLHEAKSLERAEQLFKERLEPGFHLVVRLRRLQAERRIYLVTALPETLASLLGFRVFRTMDDALHTAFRGLGGGRVLAVPQALKVLPKIRGA